MSSRNLFLILLGSFIHVINVYERLCWSFWAVESKVWTNAVEMSTTFQSFWDLGANYWAYTRRPFVALTAERFHALESTWRCPTSTMYDVPINEMKATEGNSHWQNAYAERLSTLPTVCGNAKQKFSFPYWPNSEKSFVSADHVMKTYTRFRIF